MHDDIKYNDSSERQKLAMNLFYTSGWLSNYYSHKLKDFGITFQQYNILKIIKRHDPEPVSVHVIKECMPDMQSDVSRIIERMKEKGLVDRQICPLDRRKVDVTLQDAGRDLIIQIETLGPEWEGALKNLREEEIHYLNDLLDKIRG